MELSYSVLCPACLMSGQKKDMKPPTEAIRNMLFKCCLIEPDDTQLICFHCYQQITSWSSFCQMVLSKDQYRRTKMSPFEDDQSSSLISATESSDEDLKGSVDLNCSDLWLDNNQLQNQLLSDDGGKPLYVPSVNSTPKHSQDHVPNNVPVATRRRLLMLGPALQFNATVHDKAKILKTCSSCVKRVPKSHFILLRGCTYCERKFCNLRVMRHHMQSMHLGQWQKTIFLKLN